MPQNAPEKGKSRPKQQRWKLDPRGLQGSTLRLTQRSLLLENDYSQTASNKDTVLLHAQ